MAQTQATEPDPAAAAEAAHYWGFLLKPDKTPSKLLDALLRGVTNHISTEIEPKESTQLTPIKLAAFYRSVGGNYDSLFLDTPYWPLSHIYQYLGCAHSLLPTPGDDFAPPSIPALETRGFVRWQTIQILLGPEEHVPYLQEALQKFNIVNPDDGSLFPKILPKEAFPLYADEEMLRWHEGATQRLKSDALIEQAQNHARTPDANGPRPGSRDSARTDVADDYFSSPHSHHEPARPRSSRTASSRSHSSRRRAADERGPTEPATYVYSTRPRAGPGGSFSSDRHVPDTHEPYHGGGNGYDASPSSSSAAAAAAAAATAELHTNYSRRHRPSSRSHSHSHSRRHSGSRTRRHRKPSISPSISSDSLDDLDSDGERIPVRPRQNNMQPPPPLRHHRSHELDRDELRGGPFVGVTPHPRRFSEQPPFQHYQAYAAHHAPQAPSPPPPGPAVFVRAPTMQASQAYYMPRRASGSSGTSPAGPSGFAKPEYARVPGSIRWRNVDGLFDLPPSPAGAVPPPGSHPSYPGFRRVPSRSVDGDRPRVRRFVSPIVGVDGRRYPAYESLR
ncbi:hypothetical protein L228DRAFT_268904 [Xylona heveae TC161]|uniref:DUF7514 domain-containing protein n=1 Tax=Xylona heveae (strain CBS 132557 / TC161) TaxID=1328760 RepID=A0A165GPM4_XYLHT|nr:hypothetical protein L228DRAFT_268904 [Xylona heveae TC161]KZF22440.1 hypothetical protein L228DRAFT_268904 [Xylona heveae TC161]